MNLTELRARVRQDLKDTDVANYRWTDDEVDGAIQRAVREFSLVAPQIQETDIATVSGSRDLDISSLTGMVRLLRLEFPVGTKQLFERWGTKLVMLDKGNGDDARLRWAKLHIVGATSTIPEHLEHIIVLGATGYLATSESVYTADRATIGGRWSSPQLLSWGTARLERYQRLLNDLRKDSKLISLELYD